jgi:hypothetical protein
VQPLKSVIGLILFLLTAIGTLIVVIWYMRHVIRGARPFQG